MNERLSLLSSRVISFFPWQVAREYGIARFLQYREGSLFIEGVRVFFSFFFFANFVAFSFPSFVSLECKIPLVLSVPENASLSFSLSHGDARKKFSTPLT